MRNNQLLTHPSISFLAVVFAIINRGVLSYHTSFIGKDKSLHLDMAENLLAGNGLRVTKYYLNDIYTPVFDAAQSFPPGYSLLITPFLMLFNGNDVLASTVLDVMIAVSFVLVIRWCCKTLDMDTQAVNVITIITGCFQYVFFMVSSPTDAISIMLLFAGIAQAVKISSSKRKLKYREIIWVSFLFFLPGFFRYMYLPVALIMPVVMIFYGRSKNLDLLIKNARSVLLGTLLFIIGLALFLFFYSGKTEPVYHTAKGFYPSNLVHWYPFIPASFINLDFAAQRIEQFINYGYVRTFKILEAINLLLFLGLMFFGVRKMRMANNGSPKTRFHWLIIFGSAVSLIILGILAYMSIRWEVRSGPFPWTFVADARYFGFIYIFLQILFIGWVSMQFFKKLKLYLRVIMYAGLLLLLVEVVHGVYYNGKILFRNELMRAKQEFKLDYMYFDTLIAEMETRYPQHKILVASTDRIYNRKAIKRGHTGIFDAEKLNEENIELKEKGVLIVPVHHTSSWILKKYLESGNPQLVKTVSGTEFYIEVLSPVKQGDK